MAKSLNDILKRFEDVISGKLPPSKIEPLTTGENPGVDYADKMKDGRDFVAMHTVEKHPDRNGNGDDVFKGSTKKAKMERHGHEPKPKDIQVYNKTQQVSEAKDNREYDYEGEMAVTKLKTICRHAEHLIDMMKPNTNLPEWVQSKIVKAEDYISTAHDYLMSEMNEEVESLDELSDKAHMSYRAKSKNYLDKQVKMLNKRSEAEYADVSKMNRRAKGIKRSFKLQFTKKNLKEEQYGYNGRSVHEEVESLDELTGYKKKKLFGKDPLTAVAKRAIDRMKLPPNDGKKLSPEELASNKKNRKVSQMAFDRMEEDVEELDEAKCNMTEAGVMCEVHGKKACPKEETKPSDKQPMYNGKDKNKKGKQLILDKELEEMATSQSQQKLMAMAYRYKQNPKSMPDASEQVKKLAKSMTTKQLHDYAATKRKGLPDKVEESVSDQRSARSTASEKAREKIANALERKKLEKMKHKLKTEQSAPAETVIRMPSGDVGDTGRV